MNTIKDSFSKIKASDEFKDKLLRELEATQTKLNNSNEKILLNQIFLIKLIL